MLFPSFFQGGVPFRAGWLLTPQNTFALVCVPTNQDESVFFSMDYFYNKAGLDYLVTFKT